MKMNILILLLASFLSSAFASEATIYFGRNEVIQGALKVKDGKTLHQGDVVSLKIFLEEVASFVSGPYYMATVPHIYIRFDNGSFNSLPNLPKAHYQSRGPDVVWENEVAELKLNLPKGANRVELYAVFDRVSYDGGTCTFDYDMMNCPNSFPINSEYVSNLGNNFKIEVE